MAKDLTDLLASVPNPGPYNLAARHSGDEFLLIVYTPSKDESIFKEWLKITQKRLVRPRLVAKTQVHVKVSMGVSFWPDNTMDTHMLLQQADMAMYHAKKTGKGGFIYFSDELNVELKRRVELENAIMHGEGHFGLEVFYQAKYCTNTGELVSAEALSRWRLASGELLSPAVFLPMINPGEMEKQFNLAVLTQASQDLAKFLALRKDFSVSINISPKQLEAPEYINHLLSIVGRAGVNNKSVILEVLEDAGISNPAVLENLRIIRDQGFKISIDDFGTGYSSLSHLNSLMAHELKIDRFFLNGIPGNPAAEELYINIIELARRFGLTIVSEGVENQEHLDFIKTHGCHFFQGFYYSKPMPFAQFIELLKEQ